MLGQDLQTGEDGLLRIARRVAKDRIISTVDPETRHGHKTAARGFDGYKGHIAIDPDSEIITDTERHRRATWADGSVGRATSSMTCSTANPRRPGRPRRPRRPPTATRRPRRR